MGGMCLCFTSLLFLVEGFGIDSGTGLHKFSEESYKDVIMIGIEEVELWFIGDLISLELELDDLKLGIGIEISLKSLVPPSPKS